jgi:hypothetical protein
MKPGHPPQAWPQEPAHYLVRFWRGHTLCYGTPVVKVLLRPAKARLWPCECADCKAEAAPTGGSSHE